MPFSFCPVCAAPLELLRDGPDAGRAACPAGHFVHYDNPAVTTLAFLERDGCFLVLRRADEPFAGAWDLPGGFVEAGESPEECIRREVGEETGLEMAELEILGAFASRYGDAGRHTVDIAYRARARPGEVVLSAEKSGASWVALGEMPELAFAGERAALAVLRGVAR